MSGRKGGSFAVKVLLVLGVLLVPLVIVGGCMVGKYNHVIALSENVDAGWAQVENQLQRRFDLIPNLVETVKGYAAHEKDVFSNIAQARAAYTGAGTRGQKVQAANALESALSRLLVIREAYPQLQANQNFMSLQAQLEGTENRVAVERKRYNDAVKKLNTYCRKFFGRMVANWAGVEKAEYFEVAEEAKTVPKVDFGSDAR
ncbi:MAG: LemA family protein [Phycisphaerae bacterium]|nr:LemA family protein [Phycisphaerae bacterium]